MYGIVEFNCFIFSIHVFFLSWIKQNNWHLCQKTSTITSIKDTFLENNRFKYHMGLLILSSGIWRIAISFQKLNESSAWFQSDSCRWKKINFNSFLRYHRFYVTHLFLPALLDFCHLSMPWMFSLRKGSCHTYTLRCRLCSLLDVQVLRVFH